MYTNADQMTTIKMSELIKMIECEHPLIVAVCEVKPKNAKERTLKDYEIPNFTLHPVNLEDSRGRGIAVYTHDSIGKSVIQVIPNTDFQEACLLEVRLRGGDVLLFGCLYRSPTRSDTSAINNISLNKLLRYVTTKKYSHICLVGDLNYNSINWSSWTTACESDSTENDFIETCRDSYLYQHVTEPTRRRGTDEPSLLDLILTNEEMQISDIRHKPPLGKSDHDVLSFEFQCYVDYTQSKEIYLFSKGDYSSMRKSLNDSKWTDNFLDLANKTDISPEELWNSIKSTNLDLRNQFVPRRKTGKPFWQQKGNVPLEKEVREAIRKKEKAHRSWITGQHRFTNTKREEYTRARNKVNTMLRKAKRRLERDIALKAKSNPKQFWMHTRRKLKTKSGIAPLLVDPKEKESMKFDDAEKAEILLRQFSSVFTHEKEGDIPRIDRRTTKTITSLTITAQRVNEELRALNHHKSCGPDKLHPRLLTELADEIAAPIALLFNASLEKGIVPIDWRRALVSQNFKKNSRRLAESYRQIPSCCTT